MKRVIGITGGIGSGKSRVLDHLKDAFGAEVISADKTAAELEKRGGTAYQPLIDAFGEEILSEEGELDRDAFSARIFSDPEALETVDSIVHPLTVQEIKRRAEASDSDLILIEAAVFPEGLREMCDSIWLIDADEQTRTARLMADRGYSRGKCENIIKNQMTRDGFLSFCDTVIDNNGSVEDTEKQVDILLGMTDDERKKDTL